LNSNLRHFVKIPLNLTENVGNVANSKGRSATERPFNEIRQGSTHGVQKVSDMRRVFRAGWSFDWILDMQQSLDIGLTSSKTDIGFHAPKMH
jgi:hypothetical protein